MSDHFDQAKENKPLGSYTTKVNVLFLQEFQIKLTPNHCKRLALIQK